jgi:ParB family chromosome partitioning protein
MPADEQREARKAAPVEKDADTLALEKLLGDATGMKVAISHKEKGGELRIAYRTLEHLDELCRRLKQDRPASEPRIR